MTYLDHVIRDTYIQTPSEQLDIGNDAHWYLARSEAEHRSLVIFIQ